MTSQLRAVKRILIIHNGYEVKGGEDSVVESEIALLKKNGNEVIIYERHNKELRDISPIVAATDAVWSRSAQRDVEKIIESVRPDVVHAHNTFARISPSVYWAAAKHGVPVIQSLHNFRLGCVNGLLYRKGNICEDCVGQFPLLGLVRKCYRDSFSASAAVATMIGFHRTIGSYNSKVSKFIVGNEFCKSIAVRMGLPEKKIIVKPHFVDGDFYFLPNAKSRRGLLFVGRDAPEKGLPILLDAMKAMPQATLTVVGVRPGVYPPLQNVNYLGVLDQQQLWREMRNAQLLVFPSTWYENFPRTIIEAFANGLPAIASDIGGIPEMVKDGINGKLFKAGDPKSLLSVILSLQGNPDKLDEMSKNSHRDFLENYSEQKNYHRTIEIYESVCR